MHARDVWEPKAYAAESGHHLLCAPEALLLFKDRHIGCKLVGQRSRRSNLADAGRCVGPELPGALAAKSVHQYVV